MQPYLKLIIFQAFLGVMQFVHGQDFCKSNFGNNWVTFLHYPLKETDFFEHDTIIFTRPPQENIEHQYLELQCQDSTFYLVYVAKVTYSNGNFDWVKGYSPEHEGVWRLDTVNNLITFKLNESDYIYTFQLVFVGNKETNKHDLWRSDGDYRTRILLVRKRN